MIKVSRAGGGGRPSFFLLGCCYKQCCARELKPRNSAPATKYLVGLQAMFLSMLTPVRWHISYIVVVLPLGFEASPGKSA